MLKGDFQIFTFARVEGHFLESVFKSCCKLVQLANVCMVEYNMASSAYNLTLQVIDPGKSIM